MNSKTPRLSHIRSQYENSARDRINENRHYQRPIHRFGRLISLSLSSNDSNRLLLGYGISKIMHGLYLGGHDVATNLDLLNQHHITHIINLTKNIENKFRTKIEYLTIKVEDAESENLGKHFKPTFNYIDQLLTSNSSFNILVHCNAGVSRSASIVIAYLMQKGLFRTYKEAFEFVKSKRSIVSPNKGFVKQLIQLESTLN